MQTDNCKHCWWRWNSGRHPQDRDVLTIVPLWLQSSSIFAEAYTTFKFQEMKTFLLFSYSSVPCRKFHSDFRANIGYRIEYFTITVLGSHFHSRGETLNASSECICNTWEAMIMSGIEVPKGNVALITSCFSQHTIKQFFKTMYMYI